MTTLSCWPTSAKRLPFRQSRRQLERRLMLNLNVTPTALHVLASSSARRINREKAAKYLGVSKRTLEDWGRTWRQPELLGTPEGRKGPPPFKIGKKRVLYEVRHLDHFRSYYTKWDDTTALWQEPDRST